MKRLSVWLARWLTKGTGCCVVRSSRVESLEGHVADLDSYVENSGGLQDPRRIRAYRYVLRVVGNIRHVVKDMAA